MNQPGRDEPDVAADTKPEQLARAFARRARDWAAARTGDSRTLRSVEAAAFAVSAATSAGHVCVPLPDVAPRVASDMDAVELRSRLLASGVAGASDGSAVFPLIVDAADRLYLHRYFDYECRLATRIATAQRGAATNAVSPAAIDELRRRFPVSDADEPDRQRLAVAIALAGPLAVVSGGPGTGKTSTVVSLVACLLAQDPACRIALAAPTGKAAARLLESVGAAAASLPEALRERVPREAYTVHRLLGAGSGARPYRHDRDHPLAIDALIVDEASMLDLALAARLLEAVPAAARVVLLGDRDQLAAVEAGAVFAQLCSRSTLSAAAGRRLAEIGGFDPGALRALYAGDGGLRDAVVLLTRNFRFRAGSGIGGLAAAIRDGDAAAVIEALRGDADGLRWLDDGAVEPAPASREACVQGYRAYIAAIARDPRDVAAIHRAFAGFRVLCAVRDGPRGVGAINDLLSRRARAALDAPLAAGDEAWFAGRPVVLRRNDHALRLYNGDVGIALPAADGGFEVHFPLAEGGCRSVSPSRLPDHETAFAMTVHQAQGSEFDDALFLLPAAASGVVTRELVYTAATRARRSLTIVGDSQLLQHAVRTRGERASGLLDRLREIASRGARDPALSSAARES